MELVYIIIFLWAIGITIFFKKYYSGETEKERRVRKQWEEKHKNGNYESN